MPLTGGDKDNSNGPLPLIWRHLQDALSRRFSSEKAAKRDRFILLFLTTLILALLISPDNHAPSSLYKAGHIASSDVRASGDFLVEDRKLTMEKQSEAVTRVPNVYFYDDRAAENAVERLKKALYILSSVTGLKDGAERELLKLKLSEALGFEPSPADINPLVRVKADQQFYSDIEKQLKKIYSRRIVADQRVFLSDQLTGISLVGREDEKVSDTVLRDEPIDIESARKQLLMQKLVLPLTQEQQSAVKNLLAKIMKPSLVFSREKTDEMKAVAVQAVKPVLIQIKRGEMIVRDGDRVSSEQELKLSGMASEVSLGGRISTMAGLLGVVLVLLYFPYRFALKNIRKFRPSYKDVLLLSILASGHFLLLKTLYSITPSLLVAFPSIETSDYFFLFPFAASAIMVRIFINSEVALVFSAICAPLAGLMYGSIPIVIYSLLGSVIGAHGVRHCDSRSIVFTAGMKVSFVNVAMALSFQLLAREFFSLQTIYVVIFAFAGGIAAAVLASGGIPLFESLFQYTTDIKLLELTNLNSPVLRELMVRAPGTYHHSVVVGNLVEAAAEAINANPLLARVAAYYHDIGKISKAQYFIENQNGGENRHDKLSPNMSALILISHVKEGAELARHNRLGQPIAEIIRQSHGTGLIKYFYQRALEQALPGQAVDEHDFRYPGPKPQTREAGLVMLADAVEAASRTLTDSTPARIQGLVQKIINNIFIDGQLDECELTLKNLHEIAWSFNQILAGIHHQRIDYPQPAYKEKNGGGRRQNENCDNEPPKSPENSDEEGKSGSSEDLKRLGMYF
ncbi:MAG: HDIG domain-containing protein [Geobacteraceae bacterium]|nr:HDIG domain-containing protein [Geobacteraceae bacterium]